MTLTPTVQGTYDLALLLRNPADSRALSTSTSTSSHIASSPYRLYVHPNLAYGPTSSAEGLGVVSGVAGYQSQFVVTVRDRWGNQLRNNDFNLTVVSLAPRRVAGSVLRFGNGTALVVYTPESAGVNHLSVTIAGLPIAGSPFAVQVADGDTRANTSTASGQALYAAMAGQPAAIIVQAKDRYLNPRTQQADADDSAAQALQPAFNLTLSRRHGGGVVRVSNTSTYLSQGRHLLVYNATRAGHYNLTITDSETGEVLSHGSLYTPYVRPAPGDPMRSYAYGSRVTHGAVGSVSPLYVQSVDEFGNLLDRGGDLLLASLWAPGTRGVEARAPPDTLAPLTSAPYHSLLSSLSPVYNGSYHYPPLDGPPSPSASNGQQAVALPVTDLGNGTYAIPYTATRSGINRLQLAMGLAGRVSATYYRSVDFRLPYMGREEPGLNLTWGPYGPSSSHLQGNTSVSTGPELFSLVLRAVLRVPSDGDYRFHVLTDAAAIVELRLADTTIVPSTTTSVSRRSSPSSYLLPAGALYSLEVRYHHQRMGADPPSLVVAWSTSQSPAISAIPPSALLLFYPIANTCVPPTTTDLTGDAASVALPLPAPAAADEAHAVCPS